MNKKRITKCFGRKNSGYNKILWLAYALILILMTTVITLSTGAKEVRAETGGAETLEVHYLDVGQGDCTLLKCGGEAMLIDAGDENQGYDIAEYLRNHDVDSLKYMVLTHADADHVGGSDTVMYMLDGCDLVIKDNSSKDTVSYREVNDMIKYLGISTETPKYGNKYKLGGASITLIGLPQHDDEENNNSIALIVDYANTSFIFTGDAMEAEELAIIKKGTILDCNVLKVGHHGSKSSTCDAFLQEVSPDYAVISCGEDNSYGHPHAATLNKLRDSNVKCFRTDEQGTIVAVSDGKKITWNCSPSTSWLAGSNNSQADTGSNNYSNKTNEEISANSYDSGSTSYVANRNTKKFHYTYCNSVKQMKEKNKVYFDGDRQELINKGYVPCKNCNP